MQLEDCQRQRDYHRAREDRLQWENRCLRAMVHRVLLCLGKGAINSAIAIAESELKRLEGRR